MANPALGTKRHCQSCGENYYDLNKSPIVCPHCKAAFDPEVLLKSRKTKPVAAATPKKEEAAQADTMEDGLADDIENDDNDAATDDDLLEGDDDLGVIASGSDDDEGMVSTDEAIEDELDAPDMDDE